MLNQPTIEKLQVMKLHGMAAAFQEQIGSADINHLSFEERFGLPVDQQWTWKEARALTRRLQLAKFKELAVLEDVNYQHPRGLDGKLMRTLASSEWVRQHHNILFIGPTGIGKTWLACALAHKACRDGFFALHKRMAELFRDLATPRADGTIGPLLLKRARVDVLLLDDFAMAPMKDDERRDFLEICDDRYQRRSTVLTSQLPVSNWHEQIGDPSVADSIMDRLVHNADRIELSEESMRKQRGRKPEQEPPMSRSHAHLNASSGWFAAGVEVQRAATLLSDGAFKLYVWICLYAERDRGCLQANADDIATRLHKTGEEIRACLLELRRAGVCYYGPANLIAINDRFWPYTRTERSVPNAHRSELYVNAVKRILLAYSCVSTSFTPADDRITAAWYRSGVPLEVVERALQLGCLRKYAALINHGSGTPITTLGYFRGLIDEVAHSGASADYWQYVRIRLGDLERRWRPHREQPPEETK